MMSGTESRQAVLVFIAGAVTCVLGIASSDDHCLEGVGVCTSCFSPFALLDDLDTCTAGCPANCISCSSGGVCSECDEGFGLYNGTCLGCEIGCLQCAYYLSSNNSITLCSSCDSKYTLYQGACYECPRLCTDCVAVVSNSSLDYTSCIGCNGGTALTSGSCQICNEPNCLSCDADVDNCTDCNSGFVLNSGQCLACEKDCQTCQTAAGSNTTVCFACDNGFGFRNVSSYLCTDCGVPYCKECSAVADCFQCYQGYVLDSQGVCHACPQNCDNCFWKGANFTDGSSQCYPGSVNCNAGYYYNSTLNDCLACIGGCEGCSDDTTCDLCLPTYVMINQTHCASEGCEGCSSYACEFNGTTGDIYCQYCAENYTQIQDPYSGLYRCLACETQCAACQYSLALNTTSCHSCQPGFFLVNEYVSVAGVISNLDNCRACPTGCTSCFNSSSCYYCFDGYTWYGGECHVCPENCSSCYYDGKEVICAVCNDGYLETVDKTTRRCADCPVHCSTCEDFYGEWTCIACEESSILAGSVVCESCSQLVAGCNTCELASGNSSVNCTSCNTGYVLDNNGTCTECTIDPMCSSCVKADPCPECNTTSYLRNTTGYCVPTCHTCEGAGGGYGSGDECGLETATYDLITCPTGACWVELEAPVGSNMTNMKFRRGCENIECDKKHQLGPCILTNGTTWTCSRCCSGEACNSFSLYYPGYQPGYQPPDLQSGAPSPLNIRGRLALIMILGLLCYF